MKKFIIIPVIALLCLTACDAFNSDANPVNVNGEYEGTYVGKMTLSENNCEEFVVAVGTETDVKVDVLQSADLVSLGFDDGSEASGSLKDNTTVVVKRDISESEIFHLEFSDEGITGDVEYIDKAPVGGVLGEPCATYDVSLIRQ